MSAYILTLCKVKLHTCSHAPATTENQNGHVTVEYDKQHFLDESCTSIYMLYSYVLSLIFLHNVVDILT